MASTGKTSGAEWLRLLAEKAPALRAAGVLHLELEGMTVDLARAEPEATKAEPFEPDRDEMDPLLDPATYGWRERVPGFRRQPRDEDDES